jgi:hypothetical protein
MFCLPLKATIPSRTCDSAHCRDLIQGSYKELAQNAFFFTTHLREISAQEYTFHRPSVSWSMSSTRSEPCPLGDQYTHHEVSLNIRVRERAPVFQKWIVSTCSADIPDEHANTAATLKLKSNMTVQIALDPLKGRANEESKSYLFSTLRLPKPNCLPFHLHARFAISSNRQSLIFTSGGSHNYVYDPKTAFNAWILGDLVPSLYLTSLEYLKHHSSLEASKRYDARVWWLNTPSTDNITTFVREAIFQFLPSSELRLFRSANDEWISFTEAVFSYDEPSVIRDVLARLPLPTLVLAHRHTGVNKAPSATLVDTKYVKQAFTEFTSELETILSPRSVNTSSSIPQIFDILNYIKDEAPLAGLPLFILSDKSLAFIPEISERPVYLSGTRSHCTLFSSTAFLHRSCSEEIVQALNKDASVNLQVLSVDLVPKLVEAELEHFLAEAEHEGFDDNEAKEEWLDHFWNEYNGLPGPPTLSSLESPNLKLLKGVSFPLSLHDCQPNTVVQDPGSGYRSWLVPILKKLDINVLKSHSHPILVEYLATRFPPLLINVLKCFLNKNILSFPTLTKDEHGKLASWMREHTWYEHGNGRDKFDAEKQFLFRLPVWEAQLDGRQQLLPGSDLHVLPDGFEMADMSHYLRPNIAVASSHYSGYSGGSEYFKPLPPAQILNVVQLPAILRSDIDRRRNKRFLKAMITQVDTRTVSLGELKFPDCNGTLRVISELYDHSVRLFAEDLKYTEKSSFLHPNFRDLSSEKLQILGFQQTITFATFKKCAEVVEAHGYDSSFLANSQKRNDLMEMARITFDCYKTTLPSLLMMDASKWNRLDAIAFVRPRDDRRLGVSYDVDPSYCTQLSPLLAPARIIRPEFEPIAWTQCALPLERFSDEVLAVNRTLGVPNASVVVSFFLFLISFQKIHTHLLG